MIDKMKFNNLVYCSHWEGWQIIDEENVKYWNMDSFRINNYQTEINSYLINDEIFTWCVKQILIKLCIYICARIVVLFCLNFRLNNTLLTIHIIRRSTLLTIHIIKRSTLWMLKNIKCNKHCFPFWSPSMYINKA